MANDERGAIRPTQDLFGHAAVEPATNARSAVAGDDDEIDVVLVGVGDDGVGDVAGRGLNVEEEAAVVVGGMGAL